MSLRGGLSRRSNLPETIIIVKFGTMKQFEEIAMLASRAHNDKMAQRSDQDIRRERL